MRVAKDIVIPFVVAAVFMLAVALVIGWTAQASAATSTASTTLPDPVGDPIGFSQVIWLALKAGYIGPSILFGIFGAGAWARAKRGYIVKRWPSLDDGRAWAVATILTVAAGTLVPLAAANALTWSALWGAFVSSVGLYIAPQLGASKAPVS